MIFGLILGIIFIITDVIHTNYSCDEKVIYRYIPRTFEEEQEEQPYPSDIFEAMFTQPSTWIGSISDIDLNRKEAVNLYMASQI